MYYSWSWNNLKDIPFCTLTPSLHPQGWQILNGGGEGVLRSFFHKSCPILEPKPVNSHTFCVSLHLLNKDIDLMHHRVLSRVFEGQKLPPQNAQLPPKKINIVVTTVFSNYIVTAGHWTHCNISQNCVSKCTKLHLSTYSFQKFWGGGMPLDHPRKLVAFGHSGLLPQTINPR